MEKVEILENLRFYKLAPPKFQSLIENSARKVILPQNKLLFLEGDACNEVGFVGIGSIRVSKIGETGREITLYHVNPGEGCVLNISCAFADLGYPAMATVEEETEMVTFPSTLFQEWMAKIEVRGFVFELFSRRLTQVITLIEEILFRKMDQRLAEFLIKTFDNQGKPKRVIQMTQEQIASEMGTAREVINRLLKEFERVEAIESSRGRILLRNESILKEYFQST
jgi:CRP/FNR family transcriptional regulator